MGMSTFMVTISGSEHAEYAGWSGINEESIIARCISAVPRDSRQKGWLAGVAQGRDLSVGSVAREKRKRERGGGCERAKKAALGSMLRRK